MTNTEVKRHDFIEAMSALPGPVSLVTTGKGRERRGLTVSAICSLSADPPSLIACVNKNASAHEALLQAGCFGVNVLLPGQQALAHLFTKKGIDRFKSHDWTELSTGAPILSQSLIAFDCRLAQVYDGFSHSILVGVVKGIAAADGIDPEGLLWHRRRFRTSADIQVGLTFRIERTR